MSVTEFGLHSQQDTSEDGLGLGATFRRPVPLLGGDRIGRQCANKIDRAFRALASSPSGPVHIALPRDLVDEVLPVHQLGVLSRLRCRKSLDRKVPVWPPR